MIHRHTWSTESGGIQYNTGQKRARKTSPVYLRGTGGVWKIAALALLRSRLLTATEYK